MMRPEPGDLHEMYFYRRSIDVGKRRTENTGCGVFVTVFFCLADDSTVDYRFERRMET